MTTPYSVILGAMDAEIAAVLEAMEVDSVVSWHHWQLHFGRLEGRPVILSHCGVGKVFAAMLMQHLIDTYPVTQVLFTGVAGAVAADLRPGDLILAEELVHHDMDVSGLGFEIGHIPFTDFRFFHSDADRIQAALETEIEGVKLRKGRIGTGDQFITDKQSLPALELDAVDMEGCAVAQVCSVQQVPFVIIRIISDRADEGASADFFENLPRFAQRSLQVLCNVLRNGYTD